MAIHIKCACGKSLQVAEEFAGKEGQCPHCGNALHIPDTEERTQITRQTPPPLPKSKEPASAPWLDPPRRPLPNDNEEHDDEEPLSLTTHAGTLLTDDDDLFEDAPPEIGRVLSVFTTLKRAHEPKPTVVRALIAMAAFFIGFLVTGFVALLLQRMRIRPEPVLIAMLFGIVVGFILAGVAYWWTRFKHTCSYVGTKGVAIFQCSGDRDRVTETGFFLFKDAIELRIGQTRHYYNGVYTGTDYSFTWTDEDGHTAYQFAGRYRNEAGTPGPTDPYHFALAAEDAWTRYLYRDMDRIIETDGSVYFGLRGNDFVKLGDGLLVLAQGGKKIKLRANQIEKMNIGNGVISIWEVGAKEGWFVNSGIHQFMYADLGNARFFLFALEKLLGIRF
jgi:hypothetical protein